MPVTVKTLSGIDPRKIIPNIKKATQPTVGDALYMGQHQRTRMLDRTARGVDADGSQFAPYSENGPYYYNPNGRVSGVTDKQQKSAVSRLARKVGNATKSSTGNSLKFESYAAFKRWMGRSVVDLRGAKAPHMLQAIVVKVAGVISSGLNAVGLTQHNEPAREMRVGIYGPMAERARGHNEGAGKLPRRRWFRIGRGDVGAMKKDLLDRIGARLKSAR
jgi:hypothetical protein